VALAGLRRLGREEETAEILGPPLWLPAPGQGALAVTIREDDVALADLLAPLHDPAAATTTAAERAFLAALGGGCQVPAGALAALQGDELRLDAFVAAPDGHPLFRTTVRGPATAPAEVGARAVDELLASGAGMLLERDAHAEPAGWRPPAPA